MPDDILLGLDLGTSGCKLIAFDAQGRERAAARRGYPVSCPQPGFAELDPDAVWAAAVACFRDLGAADLPGRVRALAISAQGEAIMPVDAAGNVLARSPVSADMRGEPQALRLERRLGGDRIYRITGQPVSPLPSLPKLMWWQEHRPEVVSRTWKFLCFGELALMRLGLPPAIDEGMAARTLAYDIAAAAWSAEMLAAAGLSADRLPPVRPSGTVLGTVPEQVAGNLRLPNGVAVVLGGHDQPMGALGAGVVAPGTGLYAIGTTESLVAVLDARQEGLGRHNVACYPHVLPGRFVALAGSQSGGRVLAWLRGVVGPDGEAEASVERLVAGLADEAPAWPVLLAHLAGSGSVLNDPASTGALLGLGFETTASDLVHAALEGITLEQALSLEALRSAGVPVASLRAVGGGARSFFWLQMKADVLGLEIESVAVDDAPCCGCAILAACALGLHRSPEAAVAAMVRTAGSFRPRPRRHALHAERLALYRDLYRALRPFGPRLQAIRASALRGGP